MGGSGSGKEYRGVLSPEVLGVSADGYGDEDPRPSRKGNLRDQVLIGLGINTWGDHRKKVESEHGYPPTKEQRRIGVALMTAEELADHDETTFEFKDKSYVPYGFYLNISGDVGSGQDVYGVRHFNVAYCPEDDLWLGFGTRSDSYESPYLVPSRNPELFLAQCRPLKSAEELVDFILENREKFYGRS